MKSSKTRDSKAWRERVHNTQFIGGNFKKWSTPTRTDKAEQIKKRYEAVWCTSPKTIPLRNNKPALFSKTPS